MLRLPTCAVSAGSGVTSRPQTLQGVGLCHPTASGNSGLGRTASDVWIGPRGESTSTLRKPCIWWAGASEWPMAEPDPRLHMSLEGRLLAKLTAAVSIQERQGMVHCP